MRSGKSDLRSWVGVFGLGALLLTAVTPRGASADEPVKPAVRFEQKLGAQVPLDTVFKDEAGRPMALSSAFQGRPVILNLVYFGCPNLCTWVLNGLVRAMQDLPLGLGSRYDVVTISIDPREGPKLAEAKRRSYLARYGVTEGGAPRVASSWHFLTGSRESIDRVTEAVGFHYRFDYSANEYSHPSGIIVLSPQGKVSRYFFGAHFPVDELKTALLDAGKGRISKLVDQILLLCSHYNASSSRAGETVMFVIRLLSLLGVIAMASLISWLVHAERRAARERHS